MNNFIVRTITGILFVAVIVASFLRPEAMVLLFALIHILEERQINRALQVPDRLGRDLSSHLRLLFALEDLEDSAAFLLIPSLHPYFSTSITQ